VTSMPDLDAREKGTDTVVAKGDKMNKGCVAASEIRIVNAKVKANVKDGDKPVREEKLKFQLALVDGKWFLLEPPKIAKGGVFEDQVAKMGEFKDRICACKDSACGTRVSDEMTKWAQDNASKMGDEKLDDDTMKKATEIGEQMG